MKKILLTFVVFFITVNFFTESAFSQNRKRQAGGGYKRAASTGNNKRAATSGTSIKRAKSTSSKKKKTEKKSSSSKSSSGSSSKSSSSLSNKSKQTSSPELKCLQDKIESLLSDKCKFIIDDNIRTALEGKDLYCVYNNKDSGKTSSIYNYYLNAYYGVSETSIKEDSSIINIKNKSKNALKYYQYLIDEINNGTLKESKILSSVTDTILKNSNVDFDVQTTIEEKTIDSVPLAIDIVKADIENCTKETKAILRECNATGNQEVKQKIKESCEIYNSALIKLAGDKKAEALGYEAEIITVLKERLKTELYSMKDSVAMQEELTQQKKKLNEIENQNKLLEYKNERTDTANQIITLKDEIANLGEDKENEKKIKNDTLTKLKAELCRIDTKIKIYDETYKASDTLADCKADNSTPTANENAPEESNTESNPNDKKSSET